MNKETTSIVKKTVKVGAAVCVAAGAVALMTSGAALKALTEGAKYLKNTVKKIVDEEPGVEAVVEEAPAEDVVEAPAAEAVVEEAPAAEPVAVEADFAEPEHQEVIVTEGNI